MVANSTWQKQCDISNMLMQFEKCNVKKYMWQKQCEKYNVIKIIWQMKSDIYDMQGNRRCVT